MEGLKMTAVASSAAPIVHDDLKNAILKLSEKDFWKLVETRLNLSVQQNDIIIDSNEEPSSHIEYWTEEYLIDELFLQLASTKQTISRNAKNTTVYKYYNQALALRKWIPIARPPPAFVVNISDLSARIFAELKILEDPQIILKQAVGRIFENIDSRQYHLSIARVLEVVLK
jgi:hypothetical protein